MGKKDKSINPADAHRRAQHKKEVKKNKLERKKLRDQLLLQKDPTKIAADIAKYTRLDEEGRLDAAGKQKLQRLIAGKQKIDEARKEETKTSKPAEETSKLPKDPTRSVHYHPTLNPYGIPPPGQAYQEIEGCVDRNENQDENGSKNEASENSGQSDSDSFSDSEGSDNNEVLSDTGIELPEEAPGSTVKNSDNIGEKDVSNEDISLRVTSTQRQNESNMPPLPPGAPPSFALSPIPGLDYLPALPMNPPPPTALLPKPHPAHLDHMQSGIHSIIPGTPAPAHHFIPNYGPLQPMAGFPHFPSFQGQLPPHLPYGPIPMHNQMFHPSQFQTPPNFQVPPPPVGGPPIRPLNQLHPKMQARQNHRPPQVASTQPKGQVDILSNPAQTYMRTSSHSSNPPPAPAAHPAINPLASAEGAVISAEPKLRDLKKELTSLVPTSILRKRTKTVSNQMSTSVEPKESIVPDMTPNLSSSHSVSIKLFRPKINAAPDLGDEDSESSSSIPAAPLLASGLLFPSKPPPPPAAPASANPTKDEYDAFMKEMEGLL